MPQIYSFDTILLSASKLGFPTPTNTALSANGVNVISLSSNDIGLAFNANATLTGSLVLQTIQGSVVNIDTSYNQVNNQLALVKADGSYTIFQVLSTGTVGVALSAGYTDVTTSETRRKRLYGYR